MKEPEDRAIYCPKCAGTGEILTRIALTEDIETPCPDCYGTGLVSPLDDYEEDK